MVSARSRVLQWIFPAVSFLIAFPALPAFAQNQPAASSQAASATQGTGTNYTRREIQPNLDVDHDPIPSPDMTTTSTSSTGAITAAKSKGSNVYTLHENVNEVLLPCTVVDKDGNLITDLQRDDFRVWEDKIPQTISSFQHRNVPVSFGILVDDSGSMTDKRQAVKAAALDLIRNSDPRDNAFVVNFNQHAYLDQGFTSNISDLQRGLSHYDSEGMTALYDAVAASADEMSKHAKWPRQVLLIITDGADNASRLTLEQAVRRVQQLNGPVVYSIGLLYNPENRKNAEQARRALQTLSDETGGIAYFPKSLDEVEGIATEVARVIRNQYILGYHSSKSEKVSGYRWVNVVATAPGHGKMIVKTRSGYYPQEIKQMQSMETAETTKK